MLFHISTPQTIGEYVAKQESRKASKRKSAHGSDMGPSTKNQKLLHGSLPSAPTHSEVNDTIYPGPTTEKSKLADTYLPPARAQAHDMTNPGPTSMKREPDHRSVAPVLGHELTNHELASQKSDLGHGSLPPAQAQAQEMTDLKPATKKPKLSYANLPPARVHYRIPSVERAHAEAEYYRERLRRWCEFHGFDHHLLDQSAVSDTLLMSPNFDVHKYMATKILKGHSYACGPSDFDVYPFDDLSTEKLTAERVKNNTHGVHKQCLGDLSCHSAALNTAPQVRPISGEMSLDHIPAQGPISKVLPSSGDETSHLPSAQSTTAQVSLAFGVRFKEACPPLGDQTSISLSSVDSALKGPFCYSSDPHMGYNTTPARPDRTASVGPDHDMGDNIPAARSDQIAPLSPHSNLRDETTLASSFQNSSVESACNKGGRPRGRKPRAPKIPKGPTRFQKNHPVKALVNIDVWENILLFCSPDLLLKARKVSSTFRSVLKDESLIWRRARINYFGPDMPDPPSGLSEPQYADLLTRIGCQTHGCESTKTRKTYWAFQKRLCIGCFQKAFLPVSILGLIYRFLSIH